MKLKRSFNIFILFMCFQLQAESGNFSLLTYNVAGLPSIISAVDGKVSHPLISPLLNSFDIVLVQEDFAHHKKLIKEVKHSYISKFKKAGFFGLGDGLNRMSKFPFYGHTHKKWKKCHGIFKRDTANDCLTPKGFSYSGHDLGGGVYLDIYNLHHEAGSGNEDNKAREKQVSQFINVIKEHSNDRAIIIAGDFNLHHDTTIDFDLLEKYKNELNLKDACETANCEMQKIDRIFYRSSKKLSLNLIAYKNESKMFLDSNGNDLSDHQPLSARFKWQTKWSETKLVNIRALHSDKCLFPGSGKHVSQNECLDKDGRKINWEVIEHFEGEISLMDPKTKKCLDIKGAKKLSWAPAILYPCHFKDNQRFQLVYPSSNKGVFLRAKHSKRCLDVNKKSYSNGAKIIQYKCHGKANQTWNLFWTIAS